MGDFVLYDTYLAERKVDRLLVNRATIAGGALLSPVDAAPPERWIPATDAQLALVRRNVNELRRPWAAFLTEPGAFVRVPIPGPPLTLRLGQPWTWRPDRAIIHVCV